MIQQIKVLKLWRINLLLQICSKTRERVKSDLSQIFIIPIETSSRPLALCLFKALIGLRVSSSLKYKEVSPD